MSRAASALVLAANVAAFTTPAQAASHVTTRPASIRMPMTVVGFDAAVAKENGYPTTPPRNLASLGDSAPSTDRADAQPMGQVFGNCGFSYVDLYEAGTRKYRMDTGFGLNHSAVRYRWSVHVYAPGYSHYGNYGGGLFFRNTWTNKDGYDVNPQAAYTIAYVVTGEATLSNGAVCQTGHPSDYRLIY